jgi:hypothetical protein
MRRIHWPRVVVWFGVPAAFWGLVLLTLLRR